MPYKDNGIHPGCPAGGSGSAPVSEHGHTHLCVLAAMATDLPVVCHEDAAGQIDQIKV